MNKLTICALFVPLPLALALTSCCGVPTTAPEMNRSGSKPPPEAYLTAVGHGQGFEEARRNALKNLSETFCVKVTAIVEDSGREVVRHVVQHLGTRQEGEYRNTISVYVRTSSEMILEGVETALIDRDGQEHIVRASVHRAQAGTRLQREMKLLESSMRAEVAIGEDRLRTNVQRLRAHQTAMELLTKWHVCRKQLGVLRPDVAVREPDISVHELGRQVRGLLKVSVHVEGDAATQVKVAAKSALTSKELVVVEDKRTASGALWIRAVFEDFTIDLDRSSAGHLAWHIVAELKTGEGLEACVSADGKALGLDSIVAARRALNEIRGAIADKVVPKIVRPLLPQD